MASSPSENLRPSGDTGSHDKREQDSALTGKPNEKDIFIPDAPVIPARSSNTTSTPFRGSIHIPVNGEQETDVTNYHTLVIDGSLVGSVNNVGWLSVARDARYTGNASVVNADVSGMLEGSITCRERVIIRSTAEVYGTISAQFVEIHEGAKISAEVFSKPDNVETSGARNQARKPFNSRGGTKLMMLTIFSCAFVVGAGLLLLVSGENIFG